MVGGEGAVTTQVPFPDDAAGPASALATLLSDAEAAVASLTAQVGTLTSQVADDAAAAKQNAATITTLTSQYAAAEQEIASLLGQIGPQSKILTRGKTLPGLYKGESLSTESTLLTLAKAPSGAIRKLYGSIDRNANGNPWLLNEVQAACKAGEIIHIAWRNDSWTASSNPYPTSLMQPGTGSTAIDHPYVGWPDMLAGKMDATLAQWDTCMANMIAAGAKVMFDWHHEPDLPITVACAATPPALFSQAYRYVLAHLPKSLAAGAEPVWVVASGGDPKQYPILWGIGQPGGPLDDVFPTIGYDPYKNNAGQNISKVLDFYNQVQGGLLTVAAKSKHFIFGEVAIAASCGDRTADYQAFKGLIAGKIDGFQWFDSQTWTVDTQADFAAWEATMASFN